MILLPYENLPIINLLAATATWIETISSSSNDSDPSFRTRNPTFIFVAGNLVIRTYRWFFNFKEPCHCVGHFYHKNNGCPRYLSIVSEYSNVRVRTSTWIVWSFSELAQHHRTLLPLDMWKMGRPNDLQLLSTEWNLSHTASQSEPSYIHNYEYRKQIRIDPVDFICL